MVKANFNSMDLKSFHLQLYQNISYIFKSKFTFYRFNFIIILDFNTNFYLILHLTYYFLSYQKNFLFLYNLNWIVIIINYFYHYLYFK
jgi:hypothetical protein